MLNSYQEKSGKFRVGCIKTVQIYDYFFDLIILFDILLKFEQISHFSPEA